MLSPSLAWSALALLAAASLAVGLFGRGAALLLMLALAALFPSVDGATRVLLAINALQLLTTVLAGAGGYSLDARLFGQRVIRVHPERTSV